MSRPYIAAAPPGPKHDRVVLMAQPDGSLRYEDGGGVVDVKDAVLAHCRRKERPRRQDDY